MREHGVPRVHRRRAPAARRVRRARRQLLHRARLHEPAHRARPRRHPAARRRPRRRPPDRRRRRARRVQPGADRRLRRRRGARRRRGGRRRHHRRRRGVEGRGPPRRARASCCCGWPATDGCYVPVALRRRLRRRRRDRLGRRRPDERVPRTVTKRTTIDLDDVAVPEGAAGADGRDRARAGERRDLPRLHPRLPLLPGRHDHPAGARAVARGHRRDGRLRGCAPAGSTRSGCCRCRARTTPRSPRSPRASPTATRAPTRRCRCRARGSTRSTSTSPTRSPATAAAPG